MAKETATMQDRGALATVDDIRRILGTLDEAKLLDIIHGTRDHSLSLADFQRLKCRSQFSSQKIGDGPCFVRTTL